MDERVYNQMHMLISTTPSSSSERNRMLGGGRNRFLMRHWKHSIAVVFRIEVHVDTQTIRRIVAIRLPFYRLIEI